MPVTDMSAAHSRWLSQRECSRTNFQANALSGNRAPRLPSGGFWPLPATRVLSSFARMAEVDILSASPMGSPSSPTVLNSPWTKDGTYIIEATRKAHACCKSCDAIIEAGRLRVGVVYQHLNGFVCINWHHVECYKSVCHIPLRCLEGFRDLDPQQQKVVESCHLAESKRPFLLATHTCAA